MNIAEEIKRPTKSAQRIASVSHTALVDMLAQFGSNSTVEVEIEATKQRIRIPYQALELLGEVLKAMSEGQVVTVAPLSMDMTTQKASDILGCSRPHLVKLLEEGKIAYVKVGKHRRVKFEDLIAYKEGVKKEQRQQLIDMMHADEDLGLYET